MIRKLALATGLAVAPMGASAHQLIVFASVDCEAVTVEAKFSNGNAVQEAEVRVFDGQNSLLTTLPINTDGTVSLPLESVDHATGLLIEVDTGSHDNYWIVTPDDIATGCNS
ncbi:hypothetical protein [Yoonia litorea]|uniref:hypothetical protein n=1 Tax=Yoonia litorea TaxID=1123755 RepID=UPI001042435E|nr:hypothetical protein [Yoonia litorea]